MKTYRDIIYKLAKKSRVTRQEKRDVAYRFNCRETAVTAHLGMARKNETVPLSPRKNNTS